MKRWPAGSADLAGVPLAIDDPNVITRFIMINLFTPKTAGTVNIAATTSSARVALNMPQGNFQVRVKNLDATNAVFINFGDSTVTAAQTTGVPIGPGEVAGFSVAGVTHVAAISPATATVYFTPGNGV